MRAMTDYYPDPTLAANLTDEFEDILDEIAAAENEPSVIIRDARRHHRHLNERRMVKAENPVPPLSLESVEQLLAESAAFADGGDFYSAQKLAIIAGQIARALKVTSELSAQPNMAESLVHFDDKNENRATIQVSATAVRVCFSRLLMHVMNGDTVLIEKHGKPVARLVAIEKDNTTWREEPR